MIKVYEAKEIKVINKDNGWVLTYYDCEYGFKKGNIFILNKSDFYNLFKKKTYDWVVYE
jgi:hypothetical protein